MSVEHIRKYLGLFEEDNPFYTKGKPDLNKLGTPKTSGFQSYPMQAPVWEYPEWQKEIWIKHKDKIVYEPYGSRTLGSVDWEETLRQHPELAKIAPPGKAPPAPTTPAPTTPPQTPPSTGATPQTSPAPPDSKPTEKPYDTTGNDADLENSKELLAQLKKDFQYKFSKPLVTNSEERTREKQQELYDRYRRGEKGLYTPTNPAKYPDAKYFHLNAFDASNINAKEEEWLKSIGWVRTNKVADPVHWSYIGKPPPRPMTPDKKKWIEQAKKNNPDIDDELLSDHYDKFIYPGSQPAKTGQKPTAAKEKQPAVVTDPNKAENDRKRAEELAKASEKMRQEVNTKPAPKTDKPQSSKERLGSIREERLAKSIIESFGYTVEAYDDDAVDLIRQRNIQQGKASELETGWEAERRKRRQQRKEKEAELVKQRANTPTIDTPKNQGMARFTIGDEPSNKVSRLDMLDRPIPSTQDIVNKRFTDTPDATVIKGEPRASTGAETPKKTMFGKALKAGGAALGVAGTALSINDIYNDINAGDYATAALEVASNLAFILGIPFGAPGFIGATAASYYISSQAEQNREQRRAVDRKKLQEAEKALQVCQLTLNTDQKLDDQTKAYLQTCIDNTKATIDTLKGRI